MLIRIFLVAILCCGLAACGTTQIDRSRATAPAVDMSRYFNDPKPGYRTVHITRDDGFSGSGLSTYLWMDGEFVAILERAQTVSLQLPPGSHRLVAVASGGGMNGKNYPPLELSKVRQIHGMRAELSIDTSPPNTFDVRIRLHTLSGVTMTYSTE